MRLFAVTGLFTAALMMVGSAVAADNISTNQNFDNLYVLSSQMIGHAAMARDALAFGLYSEASDNITLAQKEAADLMSQVPQFNARFSSRTAAKNNTSSSDYLFPVIDNTVFLQDVRAKGASSTNPKMDVSDAKTVNYMLFIDTKQASAALTLAQSYATEQKYDEAFIALNQIGNGAVIAASDYDTPLEAVRDNLWLTKEMIRNKQYKSASYALRHAKYELSRAEKNDPKLADSADTKGLQSQIDDMQAALAQDNPSLLQKAETKIDGWLHAVEVHLHKNS